MRSKDGQSGRRRSETNVVVDAAGIQESPQKPGAGSHTAEDPGASATRFLGEYIGGAAAGTEGESTATASLIALATNGGAGGMSVLSGRQFCRGQNVRLERR